MWRQSFAALAVSIGAALLAAPASAGDKKDDGVDKRIGEKVDRICFQRTIDGWREARGFRKAVLLERGVNNWYLVKLSGSCNAHDFRFAQSIGIESRPAGGCVRRGDVILVRGAGDFVNRCFIREMYEWDDDAPAPGEDSDDEDGES